MMTLGVGKGKDGGKRARGVGGEVGEWGTGRMTHHSCIFIWKLWGKCSWLDLHFCITQGKD